MQNTERVAIVAYDPLWPHLFEQEAATIRALFDPDRIGSIEHYGSTAVPGLTAKPIIGILLGIKSSYLTEPEPQSLATIGYTFDKEFRGCSYWKKREPYQFTLAIVTDQSDLWYDHLLIRDYLQEHPDRAAAYAAIKQQAIATGHDTVASYRKAKTIFLEALFADAKQWKQREQL